MKRIVGLAVLLALPVLTPSAVAQRGTSNPSIPARETTPSNLEVRVLAENDQRVSEQVRVQLLKISGTPVAENFATDGMTQFSNVPPGDYVLRISGVNIEETTSERFEISSTARHALQYVHVKMRSDATAPGSPQGTVSAHDLNIPAKARAEFGKGIDAMQHSDWKKAAEHLHKAIEIYPPYAAAYNNLGVIAMKQNDVTKAKASFEKAIELNDSSGFAYLNLGRINFLQRKFDDAAQMMNKTLGLDPANLEALTMLSDCLLATGHPAEAIATTRRVHAIPHERFAVVHLIAAAAFEQQSDIKDATAEYEQFLKEDPKSARADGARKALQRLSAQAGPAGASPKP